MLPYLLLFVFSPLNIRVTSQYEISQGIPSHVDTTYAFEDEVICLSLGSQILIEFKHPDGSHLCVMLPPRSVMILTGESRYVWSHSITPRKSDIVHVSDGGGSLTISPKGVRTSFTFRKITGVKLSDELYKEIADHFSRTRHTPWPRIAELLQEQPLVLFF